MTVRWLLRHIQSYGLNFTTCNTEKTFYNVTSFFVTTFSLMTLVSIFRSTTYIETAYIDMFFYEKY